MRQLQCCRRIIGNLDNQGDIQEEGLDGNKMLEVFIIVDPEDCDLCLFRWLPQPVGQIMSRSKAFNPAVLEIRLQDLLPFFPGFIGFFRIQEDPHDLTITGIYRCVPPAEIR